MKKTLKKIPLVINLIVIILLCIIIYKIFTTYASNPISLKKQLIKLGNLGKIVLILIMATQVIFAFLPGEIIEIAAGFSYGSFQGLIICLLGTIIGTVFIYNFFNRYGFKLINKFYDIKKINEIKFLKKEKHLNVIIFVTFFIPGTPKDLLTYFAPFTNLKLKNFLIITTIARIPSILTSTISGSALSNQNYQLTIYVFIFTGIASFLGLVIYKYYLHKKNL